VPLSTEVRGRIEQKRLDALATRNVYRALIKPEERFCLVVDFLTVIVPILWLGVDRLAASHLVPNGPVPTGLVCQETWVEAVNVGLAFVLPCLVMSRLAIRKADAKIRAYTGAIRENLLVKNEAEQLLQTADSDAEAAGFFRTAEAVEKTDEELLGKVSELVRQEAYRTALRELDPRSRTCCPQCGADPWKYTKGDCQLCGGTPAK
jgi:mobilome CxxCx(11)CxxC protein